MAERGCCRDLPGSRWPRKARQASYEQRECHEGHTFSTSVRRGCILTLRLPGLASVIYLVSGKPAGFWGPVLMTNAWIEYFKLGALCFCMKSRTDGLPLQYITFCNWNSSLGLYSRLTPFPTLFKTPLGPFEVIHFHSWYFALTTLVAGHYYVGPRIRHVLIFLDIFHTGSTNNWGIFCIISLSCK